MFKRSGIKARTYAEELQRLLATAATLDPTDPKYAVVMCRIKELDEIAKRSSEKFKTVIPAICTGVSLVGMYVVQQFAGILVPKALDMILSRPPKDSDKKDK